jgi:lipopolysaccharide/colanic/teichoic acid biosynthesis glycosyltransferase
MLVLGRKYKFTQLELDRLNKKFNNIVTIKYTKKDQDEVLKEIETAASQNEFDILVLNTKAKVEDNIIKYLTKLQFEKRNKKIQIITIEQFVEKYFNKCYIPEDNDDLHYLTDIKPYNSYQYILKRMIDYIGVFFLWLIHTYFKSKVKKTMDKQSPGSLYFTQPRVGKDTINFTCYKFRTMHENSEHNPYTQDNDSRIFAYGEFMRKTRIDEIPQYKNILKGEMHLIGPRAEWDILVDNYENELPYYHERHLVMPGITGWAQVNYPYGRDIFDTKQKLMYDLYYIKHWSLWLEIKVVWKTIMVVLDKKGL